MLLQVRCNPQQSEEVDVVLIDAGLLKPWPDDVVASLKTFRQGDLVKEPPFFYFGVPRRALWVLSEPESPDDADPDVFIADERFVPWGVITTQTCDLQEEGRPKKPWFAVAPVYKLLPDDTGLENLIRLERVTYLFHMSGLEPGFWVADTRIEFPIEKAWLVGRTPTPGFKTGMEYRAFAERLASNRRRPALIDTIYTDVIKPLRNRLEKMSVDEVAELRDPVDELLLDLAGDWTNPETVQLVILTDGPCPNAVKEWFEQWWDEAASGATKLNLLRPRFESSALGGLPVREYRRMIPLPFSDLSPD